MSAQALSPLNFEQATQAVREAIAAVAPDVEDELDSLDTERDLFEELELDSMDHANVMTQLWVRTGVSIAEKDYATLRSVLAIAEFLCVRSKDGESNS